MGWKRHLTSVFLVALIPVCLADSRDVCPSDDVIAPCKCWQHFDDGRAVVHCEQLTTIDMILDVLNKTSDYGYEYFIVDLSSVPYIPAEMCQIKNISRLYIMDSTMVSLFDKAPNCTKLCGLTIYGLKLTRKIQWDLLIGILNLKNLTIENSPLGGIDDKFVEYAPKSLERIVISNCSINKLHDEAFAEMTNLIDFVMDKGKISEVKRSMWPSPANNLRTYSLKNQRLETLPEGLFEGMPYLRDVMLTGNLLSQISEGVFKTPFLILRSCLLDDNPIKCNCSIRWITQMEGVDRKFWYNLLGECEEPKDLHGVWLNELSQNNFQHCEGT